MKTPTENSALFYHIRGLLKEVLEGSKTGNIPCLETLKQLDHFTSSEFREQLPWDLRHYLLNRSYAKALNFIDSAILSL